MYKKPIRPREITIALLAKSSPEAKVRITTVGGNLFDLHRTTGAGYRLENVTQGSKQVFEFITDMKLFISCHL